MMHALTVWQPQAWTIAAGHKPVENRTWYLSGRWWKRPMAIHAGKHYDAKWGSMVSTELGIQCPSKQEIALGAVVAVATPVVVIDEAQVYEITGRQLSALGLEVTVEEVQRWFTGPWGILWKDVVALPEPVPCRGAQGLWSLPSGVETAVLRQLGGQP